MNKETIDFYDKESGHYTNKRYPKLIESYTQYVFKRRLDIFLAYLEKIENDLPPNASVLEIGCADGVVFKAIEEKFPNRFLKLIGVDISPKMIVEAQNHNTNKCASFIIRDELKPEKFDLIIELGVHPYSLNSELEYVNSVLNSDGFYFYSGVGRNSIFVNLKLKGQPYLKDYKTYKQYENIFKKQFLLNMNTPYGFFVPKLWSVPLMGRLLQPIFDCLFRKITPELFHEKIYCLKKLD